MANKEDHCSNCGELEYADALFKGLCEPCLNELHPDKQICHRCEKEWATHNLNLPAGYQAGPVCDNCAEVEAYSAYCLNG